MRELRERKKEWIKEERKKETTSKQKTATTELSVLQNIKPIEVKATKPAAQGIPEILVKKTISILKSKFVSNLFVY